MTQHGRPEIRPDLLSVVIDGERIVYDPTAARVHRLDPLATAVFNLLDGAATFDEIVADLVAVFGVNEETARQQLGLYLDRLGAEGLLMTYRRQGGGD